MFQTPFKNFAIEFHNMFEKSLQEGVINLVNIFSFILSALQEIYVEDLLGQCVVKGVNW